MPVKKLAPKKTVSKKSVAPKKTVSKKSVAPRKKVVTKKVTIPRTKKVIETFYKNERAKYLDSLRPALSKGKRVSENGNVYYEYRDNRSDVRQKGKRGQLLGINEEFFDTSVINDIDDLRKQYFKLAKKYHPDTGGTTAQFQKLNDEHERLLNKLLNGSKLNEAEKKNEIEIDEAIKVIIDNIINIQNINIEVVGKWLWISSDTFGFTTSTYNALNSAGLRYIKKGGRPYMIYAGVQSKSKGKMTKEDIDKKYGKTTFTPKKPNSLNGVITNKTKLLSALKKLKKGLDNRPV
jgi:hypothetical protein